MLRITGNKDEITIREISVVHWIYSILVGAVLFSVVLLGLSALTQLFGLALSIAALISIAGFLLYFSAVPATTTKINKPGKTISVRKQNFLRYDFKVYSFNDVADLIYVDKTKFLPGETIYQIMLPLNDGVKIELSAQIRMNELEYFETADLMNKYIFDSPKQLP